jgi:hypothetical protein
MRTISLAAGVALLVAAGCSGPSPAATTPTTPTTPATPTGSATTAPAAAHGPCGWSSTPSYKHVIWIWLENHSYAQVTDGAMPELGSYAEKCGLATDYEAIRHPSLPNYIAATSGSTHGITNDCDESQCPVSGQSLYGQLPGHWTGYDEDMTQRCDRRSYDDYAARHNPAVYYTALGSACAQHDIAFGGTHGAFATALTNNALPEFAFVTPNLCDDAHSCPVSDSDKWLGTWLGRIVASPAYRAGSTLVFVTFDEGTDTDNRVATVVIGPTVPAGTKSSRRFSHYSLLRTTEELFGLPLLGAARQAASMAGDFHLG